MLTHGRAGTGQGRAFGAVRLVDAGEGTLGKSPEWRQVSGGFETCRHLAGGRAGGECATPDWTEERASRWAGDKPKTLPPFPFKSLQQGFPSLVKEDDWAMAV